MRTDEGYVTKVLVADAFSECTNVGCSQFIPNFRITNKNHTSVSGATVESETNIWSP